MLPWRRMGNACVLRGGFSMQNPVPFSLFTHRNNLLENTFCCAPAARGDAQTRGCNSVAEFQLPKLAMWVRFPSSAPFLRTFAMQKSSFLCEHDFVRDFVTVAKKHFRYTAYNTFRRNAHAGNASQKKKSAGHTKRVCRVRLLRQGLSA